MYDGTIFTSQRNGGISRYFRRLIEETARIRPTWNFDLHIIEDGQVTAQLPSGDNILITRRKYFRPGWCWLPLNYSARQYKIRKAHPTVIHTTLARPFHYAPCPLVTTIHDAIIEMFPEFYAAKSYGRAKRWWRWSAAHSDAVLTVSQSARSDILDVWSPDPSRVHVTYNGVEDVFRRPAPEEVSAVIGGFGIVKPFILYVGHRAEHKNFRVLARAIQSSDLDGLSLVLVGGADEVPELKRWCGRDQMRLHHLKNVSDIQLRGLYGGATALVFPSLYEGFGFPLVEAMSCGVPVVASDIPSSREVCGDAAEYFQPRDAADCARAMQRVRDSKKRETLIMKGIERAKLFNWSSCAAETVRIYENVLNARLN